MPPTELVSLNDPSPQRVSACPVHFIWDGRGTGRAFVRAGFLGFLVVGALLTGAVALRVPALKAAGLYALLASGAAWLLGQALTARTPKLGR